jgi:tRNA (adenine-N(1)-)-methyltransferase non-catalytic subunit
LIEDNPTSSGVLTSEEIIALREQGCSAEEIMARQIERHDGFKLKTEYSKEKWKKRKEKKCVVVALCRT